MNIGTDFNKILSTDVLNAINEGMTSLYNELLQTDRELANQIITEKVDYAKT